MCNEFIIEVLVRTGENQPVPTEEELDELEEILSEFANSYFNRLAEDSDEDGEDGNDGLDDD